MCESHDFIKEQIEQKQHPSHEEWCDCYDCTVEFTLLGE